MRNVAADSFIRSAARPGRAQPDPTPEVEVAVAEDEPGTSDHPWRVILFNDDVHTFDEVIAQLIKATGCSISRAEALAWRVHTQGKARVFEGTFEECFRVQAILNEIRLITELQG